MARLSDSAPAVQNVATAGVAGYLGGYLIEIYNVLMLVAGSYAHQVIDIVPADALTIGQETRIGLAAAIGGLVLHKLQAPPPPAKSAIIP